ncbi:MAG: DeoR family transcriptional regulator [Patescibacteria group bacterium]
MQDRSNKLLKAIVELHIKTAHPVASKILADEQQFGVSSATIRNDMWELEQAGFIHQPHISAGRVPTILGYRYYLDNLLSVSSIDHKEKQELAIAMNKNIRDLAKLLVDKVNLAVIVNFAPHDLYFTGLFNLFSQPEFSDYKMVLSMSQVVDSLEKAMAQIFHNIDKPQVLLGRENPFNIHCAAAIAPLKTKQQQLLTILGPVRMDYNRILALLDEVVKIPV